MLGVSIITVIYLSFTMSSDICVGILFVSPLFRNLTCFTLIRVHLRSYSKRINFLDTVK